MEQKKNQIYGIAAPGVRLTPLGAALVALMIAVPLGSIIGIIHAIWF